MALGILNPVRWFRKPAKQAAKVVAFPLSHVDQVTRVLTVYQRAHRVLALLEEGKMAKSLFTSKTFWFNLLTAGAALVDVIPLPPEATVVIVGLINIGLRLVTQQPVTVLPAK